MSNTLFEILMQCPCSGDGGTNPLLLLAIFAAIWLLFNWITTLVKSKGVSLMNKGAKIIIILALVAVVGIVITLKQKNKSPAAKSIPIDNSATTSKTNQHAPKNIDIPAKLPRLVDLGAGKCIPCKMMMPILEEIKNEYKAKLDVEFIDVWKNPNEGKKYGIRVIPTQIFYSVSGKELFRHEGFFSKEDILAKWKNLGVDLPGPTDGLPVSN